jgi:ABC-2 type transport system ATP-binding protein
MIRTAIHAKGVSKSYDENLVLDDFGVAVEEGTVFALLGPNGAGKTTAVHILSTLLPSDAGSASIFGHDVADEARSVRSLIGVTGQFSAIDKLLTGRENLRLMTDLRHLGKGEATERVEELLDRFDLADDADKPAMTYSGGMRRRLDLAMTLVGDPRVIFLDEPTTGLDPRSRHTMWDTIRRLVEDGVTIFLTTQYLEEADELADRIALLDRGKMVAEGTAQELKRLVPGGHLRLEFGDSGQLRAAAGLLDPAALDEDGCSLDVLSDGSVGSIRQVLARLDEGELEVSSLTIHTPDLDDVFFALTGDPRDRKEGHR